MIEGYYRIFREVASTMLSMQDILIALGTSLHTMVKGTICHNGIVVQNLRLQWKDSIAFTHPSGMSLNDHLDY